MPLQNRADPFGNLFRTPARGRMMGNRGGILHNSDREIVRRYKSRRWITCVLEFKDRRRIVMSERRYTELFFLDEATAFAARGIDRAPSAGGKGLTPSRRGGGARRVWIRFRLPMRWIWCCIRRESIGRIMSRTRRRWTHCLMAASCGSKSSRTLSGPTHGTDYLKGRGTFRFFPSEPCIPPGSPYSRNH
jgi:hypothetical protein